MAKNLLNKYVWLVETIYKAKRITFEEINEKWLDNDMSEGVELALRTFHKWRVAVEEMFGLVIECERKGGYHYYIENASEIKSGSIRSWLLSTISVSNLLIENQNMKNRILLEDVPSGQEHLSTIIEAMKKNNVLRITYQSSESPIRAIGARKAIPSMWNRIVSSYSSSVGICWRGTRIIND